MNNKNNNGFYKPVCEVLSNNLIKKEIKYHKSLSELAAYNNLEILSCNNHKAMCIGNRGYVLVHYIHNNKGYSIDQTKEKEYFKSWDEFRKDYLAKIKES